jgi:hypothetical protein
MGMFLSIAVFNRTAGALCPCAEDPNDSPAAAIQTILDQMHQTAQTVQTLQADLTYLFVQDPELLDAKTLRQGKLFYVQGSRGARSHLRISFETVQQDEEPPQPRLEHYLFDGVWLTKIDMSLETVDRYQKAPADKPVGVFEFISHNFPMVGFTDPKTLQNEFEIVPSPVPQDPNQPQHLSLKVRPGSRYKEDYTEMEVWIDRKIWLPVRLTAKSVQGDFYDLKWTNIRMNEKIAENVFQIETPSNFRQNSHPLEQNPS